MSGGFLFDPFHAIANEQKKHELQSIKLYIHQCLVFRYKRMNECTSSKSSSLCDHFVLSLDIPSEQTFTQLNAKQARNPASSNDNFSVKIINTLINF